MVRVVINPGPEKEVGSCYFWNAQKEARGWMKWTKQTEPPHTELVTISANQTVSRAKSEYQNRAEGKGLQLVINKKKACYTPSLRNTYNNTNLICVLDGRNVLAGSWVC